MGESRGGIEEGDLAPQLGMSYRTLAKKSGLTLGFISRVMNRKRKPSLKSLTRMCEATGMSVDEMMGLLGMSVSAEERVVQGKMEYVIGDRHYNRLSHVLGIIPRPGLEKWRKEVGEEEAQRIMVEAADFGTLVHRVTEASDKSNLWKWKEVLKERPDIVACVEAWERWRDRFVKEIVDIEKVVWSDEWLVAGTTDRAVIMKGDDDVSIVDIKTGGLWETVGVQLAGYMVMYNERGGAKGPARRRIAVQLPRKDPGTRRIKEYSEAKWEDEFKRVVTEYNETVFYDNI